MANSLITTFSGFVGEHIMPTLKTSKFKEKGVITPEEFVAAGDHLVHHCPTWQWCAPADKSKTKDYLKDSQKRFLVTRNVPCSRRFHQLDYDSALEKVIDEDGDDEGWVDTHHNAPESGATQEMDKNDKTDLAESATEDSDGEEQEAMDPEEILKQLEINEDFDPNALDPTTQLAPPATVIRGGSRSSDDSCNIIETRTYDLNITYDKYYQVPRLWLVGYDEKRRPLSVDQMYEDFSSDHAKKTITMEYHPFIPGPLMASIHPCKHASVMLRLIEQLAENGKDLDVHQYLLIFLKFVQAVIPTIEYDFTRNVNVS